VCQSSVRFPRTYFTAFNFSGSPSTFSVQLAALADALRVFAALPDVAVVVTETEDHLVLETAEIDEGTTVSMYAHLAILGTTQVVDILDHWQPPATEFLTNTAILREAVEDLEWPQGHIRVVVQAQPLQVCGALTLSRLHLYSACSLTLCAAREQAAFQTGRDADGALRGGHSRCS
jgi:hypothetical protein